MDTPASTPSISGDDSVISSQRVSRRRREFISRKIEGQIEKPWLEGKKSRIDKITDWIIYGSWIIGALIIVGLGYKGVSRRKTHKFCLEWEDNFEFFNTSTWTHDIGLGGFGTGAFDWTTNSTDNTYVENGILHLKPTLTDMSQYKDGSIVNLTATGECTVVPPNDGDCVTMWNSTSGQIINPVQSSRIHTKNSVHMKYGKLEMRAKLPQSDWTWNAFWMMPVDSSYGIWPASGEIDIFESRGNNYSYVYPGNIGAGNNVVTSAIHDGSNHVGEFPSHNRALGEEWHTYTLIWTEDSITTYVDNEMRVMMEHKFKKGDSWQSGYSGNKNAPFDMPFYIIINSAVGSCNDFFSEMPGAPWKPWSNDAQQHGAMKQFIDQKRSWIDTWQQGDKSTFQIDWIKMYKLCD